jgi:trk system potassium uptake protein TrkH
MKLDLGIKNFTRKIRKKFVLRPVLLIALSFFIVIMLGSVLLVCPFAHEPGVEVNYLNALFTSVTATCVTGLVDLKDGIAASYSLAGEIIILILIQLGGLGVTSIGTFFVITIFGLSLSQQQLIKEAWNLSSAKILKKIFFYTILITAVIEILGAILSFISFYCLQANPMTLEDAIYNGVFHSISAFNNAGIDLLGSQSLINHQEPLLLTTTALLITFGGLGYVVIIDVLSKKFNFKRFKAHTKIVLSMTLILFIIGSLMIFLTSYSYTPDVGGSFVISFENSMFLCVSTRTAGFTTVDLGTVPIASLIIMIMLMFVGASPGGTGGGIKTTTIFVIFAYIRSVFQNKEPYGFRREMNKDATKKALLLFVVGIVFIILISLIISVTEMAYGNVIAYDEVLFETTSAFATVGLTTGITPGLSEASRVLLILLMYLGRIGPMSITTMLKSHNIQLWHYVEENIPIG